MERLTQEEFMKLSPKEQFEYKIYWIDLGRANVKKCYRKYHKEVLKPLGFTRAGTTSTWYYDLGWSNIQMELLPSRNDTHISVRVGLHLMWSERISTYDFTYMPYGSNEIKRVKYDPDILKIEEMLNTEMTEIIKKDILDFFLPMKDPVYAFNASLPMLVKSNNFVHTMYKDLYELAIFIDETGTLANSLLFKEELEIVDKYRAKGILTPEEAKAMRKELVDKINKNRSENIKLLSWKDYVAE